MAIRMPKPENTPTPDNDDNNDDIPMDITDETHTREYINNGQGEGDGLTLEQLDAIGFNEAQDEDVRKKMNDPVGDWIKSERWTIKTSVKGDDHLPGDFSKAGRSYISFEGYPEERYANDLTYKPKLWARMSPDARYKEDGKPDMASKLFNKAKDLYLSIHGEKPQTFTQLAMMLENDEYIVKTMRGDNGPVIIDLKTKERVRR